MRVGLAASFLAHSALIALGLFSLSSAKPHRPDPIESITIDIVPIEEFTNIRVGSERSEIIETPTPSPVDSDEVATLGERTGSTQEDQPNPQETDIVTPAPTIQTAPAPETIEIDEPKEENNPAPKPEQVVEKPPEPEPTPMPEEKPEPVLSTQEETDKPEQIVPKPVLRTASIDKKRQQYQERLAKEKQKKQKEKEAREATKISDIINAEESRGATTGTGGQASAGKPTGQAARLTRSERDALAAAMRKCWNPPLSALSQDGLTVRLLVNLNKDGSVAGTPRILSQISSSIESATARAAQRAVVRCSPYKLSPSKYDDWKQVDVTFDPRDLS